MGNFDFLLHENAYRVFARAAVEAEGVYRQSPAMCAIGCRKALELAVNWVYAVERDVKPPYRDNLQSLLHEPTFMALLPYDTWKKLPLVVKLGNLAVHTSESISPADALVSLRALFEFIQWIDCCYGKNYEDRTFDEKKIPGAAPAQTDLSTKNKKLLAASQAENAKLYARLKELSAQLSAEKAKHTEVRTFRPDEKNEAQTRKVYIDVDLKGEGWKFTGTGKNVLEEFVLDTGERADYVLLGKDGRPLAVVEAKKTGRDPHDGQEQVRRYGNALERQFGQRPFLFFTNGFETWFWDDTAGVPRRVSGIFSEEDLHRLMLRKQAAKPALATIPVSDAITNRAYQKEAVRAVCANLERGGRKNLLVMATGTGKTRTAASVVDVLSRGNWITHVLFLADRTALVTQAKNAFREYLPRMSLCSLLDKKDDPNARIVFSTYPTMLNAIDTTKKEDGERLFTPAHFDLIIIDESHRSIFKKYRTIFQYFDGVLLGLTATPKTDVDRNTYDFFGLAQEVPTYAYDYGEAIRQHYLVPYYNYEVKTEFLEEGIHYEDLSPEDRERYEEDFAEDDGGVPDFIPSAKLNTFVFNQETVDRVLEDLMERGIRVQGGDRLGKTIIFAENKKHAAYIVERFNALYPRYRGTFAQRVVCDDSRVEQLIADFKNPDREPVIAVSVDMLDTGVDVPECVNLVFFKKVRSKTKFWQMIGRGTRLCPDLECVDGRNGAYTGKKYFLIFDYCGNFEFFRQQKKDMGEGEIQSLSEALFVKRVRLMKNLQTADYEGEEYQNLRQHLMEVCCNEVKALNPELTAVKLHLRAVETWKCKGAYLALDEGNVEELTKEIAPLVQDPEKEESAKRFDNFMYGLMLAEMEHLPGLTGGKRRLIKTARLLSDKISIDAVRRQLPLLKRIINGDITESGSILTWEEVRQNLRELIQFLTGDRERTVVTVLKDPVLAREEGRPLVPETFETYKDKVNSYFNQHADDVEAVRKLVKNEPLTEQNYKELENIFTKELGTKEEYNLNYQGRPFGLVVRTIAKMEPEAAEKAFSRFINDHNLNDRQIAFVKQVIRYIEVNGYMDTPARLMQAPFDRPYQIDQLFNADEIAGLVGVVKQIKENAETAVP